MNKKYLPALLPMRSVIFLLIFVVGAAIVGKNVEDIGNWWSVVATAVNLVTILILIPAAKGSGMSFRKLISYEKSGRSAKKVALTALIFAAVGMGCMYGAGFICYGSMMPAVSLDIIAPISAPLAVINLILLPATVSFAEDGLYLGCGAGQIGNKYAGVIIPAFFYALQHCFIPTFFDVKYMLYRFLCFLPLTVIFCIYFRKKKDPVPIMIGHAVLDLATGVMIFMTSVIPGMYDKMQSMM